MKFQLVLFFAYMVKYLNAECAHGVYEYGVSKKEQDILVKAHNDFRLQIAHGEVSGQPKGINLKRMKWDNGLAVQAQNLANTCKYEHIIQKDSRWGQVGQNLYTSYDNIYNKTTDWDTAVTYWFDGHYDYTYGVTGFTAKTGHYTQVVWADTDHVGCGYTHFRINTGAKYEKLYACNYGPPGNVGDGPPYKSGYGNCNIGCIGNQAMRYAKN